MSKKGTILVVDDEQNIRLLVGNLLGGDYEVLKASNGAEALDLAHRQKPNLILMDIMMPGMDGYSACHAIKSDESTCKIPVVMVTAVGQELNRMFATQMGADGYITISHEELGRRVGLARQTVSELLGKWRRAGWILTGRGKIVLLNRAGLRRQGEEERS